MSEPIIHGAVLIPVTLTHLAEGRLNEAAGEMQYPPLREDRRGYFGPRPLPGMGAMTIVFFFLH